MLGDDMPWLVPLFFGSIAIWMFPKSVETFALKKSESLLRALRWLPFALLAVIISLRVSALFTHDTSHIEVAAYLNNNSTITERLHVLFAGDGLVEWMVLPLVYLFAWNGQGSRRAWTVEGLQKMKRTLALMLLVSSTLLFDDSAYIAPETMPLVSMPAPHIDGWSVVLLVLVQFVVLSGLLQAHAPQKGLRRYQQRFYLPASPFVLTAFAFLFMAYLDSGVFDASWWSDPRQDDPLATMWLWVFVAFNLHIFAVPQSEIDPHLGAGNGRSKALAWSIGVSVTLLIVVTALLMHNQHTPDATSVRTSLWLVGWMGALMAAVLLLPLLGFDDGPRPELNWVRWSLMFGPLFWFLMFEHAPFLMVGSWLALIATTPLAWTLEDSAPSPSMAQRASMVVLGLATILLVLASDEGLRYALPLVGLLCVLSSMLDLRHATLRRQ
ncbi:MAG: hypothetical protein ACPHCK_04005 [Candidatus Poseidoniaceae archaeon]